MTHSKYHSILTGSNHVLQGDVSIESENIHRSDDFRPDRHNEETEIEEPNLRLNSEEIASILEDFKSHVRSPKEGSILHFLSSHKNRNSKSMETFFKKKLLPVIGSGFADKDLAPISVVILMLVLPKNAAMDVSSKFVRELRTAFPDGGLSHFGASAAERSKNRLNGRRFDLFICSNLLLPGEKEAEDYSDLLPGLKSIAAARPEVASYLFTFFNDVMS